MKKFLTTRMSGLAVGAVLSAAVLFMSCNKSLDDDNSNNTPVAGLMAFNLATDTPPVSIALSGSLLTAVALGFNNYSGAYLAIYPGTRTVESYNYATGADLADTSFNFEATKYYSVFVVGSDNNYENIVVEDKLDSVSAPGKAFIRYINAIPDAAVPSVTITANGTTTVNEPAAFKTVSAFTAVDAGSVAITVSNGTTIDANRSITLEQNKIYTVLLIGKPGATGETAVQIKYITNGTTDENAAKSNAAAAKTIN